jgi:Protein of unknown function (DUF3040)
MALSHHEQQALERIASELRAVDPQLAARLDHDGGTAMSMQRKLLSAATFFAALVMMTAAIFIPHDTTILGLFGVSILAYVMMFLAALSLCKNMFSPPRRVGVEHADAER